MLSDELVTEVLQEYPVEEQDMIWFTATKPFEVDGIVYDYAKRGNVSQPMFEFKGCFE